MLRTLLQNIKTSGVPWINWSNILFLISLINQCLLKNWQSLKRGLKCLFVLKMISKMGLPKKVSGEDKPFWYEVHTNAALPVLWYLWISPRWKGHLAGSWTPILVNGTVFQIGAEKSYSNLHSHYYLLQVKDLDCKPQDFWASTPGCHEPGTWHEHF